MRTPPGKDSLIFGRKPLIEAIEQGQSISRIFLQRGVGGPEIEELRQLINQHQIPFQTVPPEKLQRLTRKNHQGVVAYASPVPFYKVEDILEQDYQEGRTPFLLILDGITDMGNLGAIIRSAVCFDVSAIVLPFRGGAPVTEDTMKASAGALSHIHLCRESDLVQTVKDLRDLHGFGVYGSTLKPHAKDYIKVDWTVPSALILGSEHSGMSKELEAACTEGVRIPMSKRFDSLNVSVAAGVVLAEVFGQRK